jgi:hypothetical protein
MNAGSYGLLVQTRPADTVAGALPHPSRHRGIDLFHRTRQRASAGARRGATEIATGFLTVLRRISGK